MSSERKGSASSSSSGGLMHSIKQSLWHGDKHIDADYEAIATKFITLNDSLHKIRASAQNYVSAVYSVFLHANNASADFAVLLEDATTPNPYQQLCGELRGAHSRLSQERQQQVVSGLTDRVIRPIDETLKSFIPLHERITKRNQLHSELEYYLNKIHALDKERSDRTAKGKAEKAKDIEKYDRNQDKLSKARFEYQSFTSLLMADLTTAWNARVQLVGPALAAFVEAGKGFVQTYGMELSQVNNSSQLIQPPSEVQVEPTHPREVPLPTVAGDLHAAKPNALAGADVPPEGQYVPAASVVLDTSAPVTGIANDTASVSGASLAPQQSTVEQQSNELPSLAPMPSPNVSPLEPVGVASSGVQSEAVGGALGSGDSFSIARPINDTTTQSMSTQGGSSALDGMNSDAPLLDQHTSVLGGGLRDGEFVQGSTAAIPREVTIDPTTVLQEQASYSHESAKPGLDSHTSFNINDSGVDKSDVLKSQGEEESKRQRYEEDNKFLAAGDSF